MRALPLLLLTSLWPLACQRPDPQAEAAAQYAADVAPLMAEDEALSRQLLGLASQMKQGDVPAAEIGEKLRSQALPAARSLGERAGQVSPADAELAVLHARLEEAWQDRAAALEATLAAWEAKDLAAFDAAVAEQQRLHREVERYLFDANAVLRPHGASIEVYP